MNDSFFYFIVIDNDTCFLAFKLTSITFSNITKLVNLSVISESENESWRHERFVSSIDLVFEGFIRNCN